MAHPMRKHSPARRGKRRAHWNLKLSALTKCPQCARPIRPHHICDGCGYYRGRQVIVVPSKEDKKKGKEKSS